MLYRYANHLVTLFFCFSMSLHGDWETSPPLRISTTSSSATLYNVSISCNATTGQSLATWTDLNNNNYPTYAFYNPDLGWSSINTISTVSQSKVDVSTSCDPSTGIFLATWTDANTNLPTYSTYVPETGWSSADVISNTSIAFQNTINSFDSKLGQFVATWSDSNNSFFPTYSFFTPCSGWTTANTITNSFNAANVTTTFDSETGDILALWVDQNTGFPVYSFYSSNAWSVANYLAISSVDNDVFGANNPLTGEYLAVWADINNNNYPTYSLYTPGSGWSSPAVISTFAGVVDNVTISCDTVTGQFLAFWNSVANGDPIYSFFTSDTGWSSPQILSSTITSHGDTNIVFNSLNAEFLVVYANSQDINFYPFYSIFSTSLPRPPLTFTGQAKLKCHSGRKEIEHKLKWTPPLDTSSIVTYEIKKNNVIVANIPVTSPPVYEDYSHFHRNNIDVYTITSVDAYGRHSLPLNVIFIGLRTL